MITGYAPGEGDFDYIVSTEYLSPSTGEWTRHIDVDFYNSIYGDTVSVAFDDNLYIVSEQRDISTGEYVPFNDRIAWADGAEDTFSEAVGLGDCFDVCGPVTPLEVDGRKGVLVRNRNWLAVDDSGEARTFPSTPDYAFNEKDAAKARKAARSQPWEIANESSMANLNGKATVFGLYIWGNPEMEGEIVSQLDVASGEWVEIGRQERRFAQGVAEVPNTFCSAGRA